MSNRDEQTPGPQFSHARTHNTWLDKPVEDALLRAGLRPRQAGADSANMCPMRIGLREVTEARNAEAALDAGNVDKTMAAPVTAILAWTSLFLSSCQAVPARDAGEAPAVVEYVEEPRRRPDP